MRVDGLYNLHQPGHRVEGPDQASQINNGVLPDPLKAIPVTIKQWLSARLQASLLETVLANG